MAERGWIQADLARRSGLDWRTIKRLLDGERGVGPGAIAGLLVAFEGEITFERLFRVGDDLEDLFRPGQDEIAS
jgi:hypothetical protein